MATATRYKDGVSKIEEDDSAEREQLIKVLVWVYGWREIYLKSASTHLLRRCLDGARNGYTADQARRELLRLLGPSRTALAAEKFFDWLLPDIKEGGLLDRFVNRLYANARTEAQQRMFIFGLLLLGFVLLAIACLI